MITDKAKEHEETCVMNDSESYATKFSNASTEVSTEASTEVKLKPELLEKLLEYCTEPRSRKEMQEFCGIRTEKYFREQIIKPMLEAKLIAKTIPDKPTSAKQKYVSIKKSKI